MEKRRDHRTKRGQAGIRAVPDAVDEEEVVRLGSEVVESVPRVERLEVQRAQRVRPKRSGDGGIELAVDQMTETPELEAIEDSGAPDLEEVWAEARGRMPQVPIGWIVVLVACAVGVLVVALWKIPEGDVELERRAAEVAEKLDEERLENQEAAKLTDQIEAVVTAYLGAETVEEKLQHVRMPSRVRPLMEKYYEDKPLVARRTEGFYVFEPVALENYPFFVLRMTLEGGSNVVLLLEEDGQGSVKVDWESEVAYQEMSLEDYVQKRPGESLEFRVIVEYDEYYAFEFADSDRYVNLAIRERDGTGFLFGYVERHSEVHDRLIEVLGRDSGVLKSMILRVRFLPGTKGVRSVLVEDVVAPGWALVVPPGGEG